MCFPLVNVTETLWKYSILVLSFRYILRAGVSGFYSYAIYELPPGCRAFDVAQTRMVFKLRQER